MEKYLLMNFNGILIVGYPLLHSSGGSLNLADFHTFAGLISGSISVNLKMLLAISKKPPWEEKEPYLITLRGMFKRQRGSALAGGLAQCCYTTAAFSSRGGCPASGTV